MKGLPPGACTIIFFTIVSMKLECLSLTVSGFCPSLIFQRWLEHLLGLVSIGRLLTLPGNIRLGWKWLTVTNTLAYFDTVSITAVKSFIVQNPDFLSLQLSHTHSQFVSLALFNRPPVYLSFSHFLYLFVSFIRYTLSLSLSHSTSLSLLPIRLLSFSLCLFLRLYISSIFIISSVCLFVSPPFFNSI